jgi:hypothetical protein
MYCLISLDLKKTRPFLNGLPQARFYGKLPLEYVKPPSMADLFSLSLQEKKQPKNLLKAYFTRSQHDLTRYRGLLATPEELYKALELDSSATENEVKSAYRRIAKETQAIHIKSPDEFDAESWSYMNRRFTEAIRAYKALSKHKMGDTRITTFGKITSYFESE